MVGSVIYTEEWLLHKPHGPFYTWPGPAITHAARRLSVPVLGGVYPWGGRVGPCIKYSMEPGPSIYDEARAIKEPGPV